MIITAITMYLADCMGMILPMSFCTPKGFLNFKNVEERELHIGDKLLGSLGELIEEILSLIPGNNNLHDHTLNDC